MTTTDPKQRLVTMREAAGLLEMDSGTLLKWIKAGIFRPADYRRGSVGPGKGTKLDFPDLVTAAALGLILRSGLRYEHLQMDKSATIPVRVMMPALPPENGIITIGSLGEGRMIQQYLKRLKYAAVAVVDFECDVIMDVNIERNVVIWFAPEWWTKDDWRQGPQRWSVFSEKITVIYCGFWADLIEARLRQLP